MSVTSLSRRAASGTVPYGYRRTRAGHLEPDPDERLVVEAMRFLYCRGLTYRRIADALNSQEVPTRNGAAWHPGSVHRILARYEDDPIPVPVRGISQAEARDRRREQDRHRLRDVMREVRRRQDGDDG